MLYLNTDLRPGPYLRTLLAHEYTHAVVFSEHVFGNYLPDARRCEEEGWLNEGLAHFAEERHGFSWSNLDYRVSAFLAAPQRYPLVVPDYYGAGLWRDPGCRGACYLFLHACACEDAGLSQKLIRSNLCGVANLEAAAREAFAALFRRWTVAVAQGKIPGGHDLYRSLGDRPLFGVRRNELPLTAGQSEADVAGTSAAYFLLHSPSEVRSRVTIEADADADLQVTLIPLPPDMPRLSLRAEAVDSGSCRLTIAARDADVTLDEAAVEEAAAERSPAEKGSRLRAAATVSAWFGDPHLAAGVTRFSVLIERPAGSGRTWLFKIKGHDAAGRPVAAYAALAW
jgi:hypothetical protein